MRRYSHGIAVRILGFGHRAFGIHRLYAVETFVVIFPADLRRIVGKNGILRRHDILVAFAVRIVLEHFTRTIFRHSSEPYVVYTRARLSEHERRVRNHSYRAGKIVMPHDIIAAVARIAYFYFLWLSA